MLCGVTISKTPRPSFSKTLRARLTISPRMKGSGRYESTSDITTTDARFAGYDDKNVVVDVDVFSVVIFEPSSPILSSRKSHLKTSGVRGSKSSATTSYALFESFPVNARK